ncbi:hypothetical protein V2G26_015407 [Clonostachys chloroleuca]|uniref:Presequence translocated-associated motor subunit PAM17 n=3 Tax=Clonostachys TaxID=110564 RepID=A0A9N9YEC5_9HYPO|nr:unnamed protein product [Clonostachys byssicola]CAH0015938.1 unnamed protein product [Clonostachys rhizophaga]CAI6090865.1 unnamed protein product [Clonostachys chloroleuca]
MSSSLKTVGMRLSGSLASRCCPRATTMLATAARPICLSQQNRSIFPAAPFARANSSLASNTPAADKVPALDWNTFFKLRLRRRRIQVFFSAITGIGGFVVGAGLLSSGIADSLVSQVPLDPFFTLGGLTIVFAGAGWLIGPSIGNQVFYLLNRQIRSQIHKKEDQFLARIRKNRVDPTNSSASNPVPDFYGEKIQSVQGYRRWLKDQRAFNKKKTANFV